MKSLVSYTLERTWHKLDHTVHCHNYTKLACIKRRIIITIHKTDKKQKINYIIRSRFYIIITVCAINMTNATTPFCIYTT